MGRRGVSRARRREHKLVDAVGRLLDVPLVPLMIAILRGREIAAPAQRSLVCIKFEIARSGPDVDEVYHNALRGDLLRRRRLADDGVRASRIAGRSSAGRNFPR